jgi:cytoskeletal protein CcmA (bactofilin family)
VTFRRQKPVEPPKMRPTLPSTSSGAKIETVIGPNCHVQGTIQSDGGIRIDGIFQGDIDTTGNVIIGESAKVIAEIKANNVSVAGAVKGNVTGNKVEVLETGRVWGDLTVNSLLLNEGAYLRGQTMMHADLEPPMIEPPKAQTPPPPPPPPTSDRGKAVEGEIVDIEPE